jgi:hypothetical protein
VLAGVRIDAALAEPRAEGRETQLHGYAEDLKAHYGGYYTLGRWFVRAIGNPSVMKIATTYGMPVPVLRELALKLMANLTDTADPDPMDRLINVLSRVTPAA